MFEFQNMKNINFTIIYPVDIYLLKVNNKNTRTRCEMCSKLTIKTPKRCPPCSSVSVANFEQVIAGWVT